MGTTSVPIFLPAVSTHQTRLLTMFRQSTTLPPWCTTLAAIWPHDRRGHAVLENRDEHTCWQWRLTEVAESYSPARLSTQSPL